MAAAANTSVRTRAASLGTASLGTASLRTASLRPGFSLGGLAPAGESYSPAATRRVSPPTGDATGSTSPSASASRSPRAASLNQSQGCEAARGLLDPVEWWWRWAVAFCTF